MYSLVPQKRTEGRRSATDRACDWYADCTGLGAMYVGGKKLGRLLVTSVLTTIDQDEDVKKIREEINVKRDQLGDVVDATRNLLLNDESALYDAADATALRERSRRKLFDEIKLLTELLRSKNERGLIDPRNVKDVLEFAEAFDAENEKLDVDDNKNNGKAVKWPQITVRCAQVIAAVVLRALALTKAPWLANYVFGLAFMSWVVLVVPHKVFGLKLEIERLRKINTDADDLSMLALKRKLKRLG